MALEGEFSGHGGEIRSFHHHTVAGSGFGEKIDLVAGELKLGMDGQRQSIENPLGESGVVDVAIHVQVAVADLIGIEVFERRVGTEFVRFDLQVARLLEEAGIVS